MIKLFISLLGIDQTCKCLSRKLEKPCFLCKNIKINHIENTGIAFGFLKDNPYFSLLINLLSCLFLIINTLLTKNLSKYKKYGFTLMLVGSISNIIDRVFHKSVTDMICFPKAPGTLKRLVFNLADFYIIFGTLLFNLRRKIYKPH